MAYTNYDVKMMMSNSQQMFLMIKKLLFHAFLGDFIILHISFRLLCTKSLIFMNNKILNKYHSCNFTQRKH